LTGNDGNCYQGVYEATYFLGIRLSSWESVTKDNGRLIQETVPCGEEYAG